MPSAQNGVYMTSLKWIKPELQKKIASLIEEKQKYQIRYRYDWVPSTKREF
jgi:hypothetical protein